MQNLNLKYPFLYKMQLNHHSKFELNFKQNMNNPHSNKYLHFN